MKRFLIIALIAVMAYFTWDFLYYRYGLYINFNPNPSVTSFAKVEGEKILLNKGNGFKNFEIRGVNMGAGIPGHFATEYAVDKETYLRWFSYIQEMGANTIRVYTTLNSDFYDAVYEYNKNNLSPIYILHGVWVNDYIQNSHRDAYDKEFVDKFLEDSKDLVDIIHGKKKLSLGRGLGSGYYNKDISPWVIGYILGVEWEDVTVTYTDHKLNNKNSYKGNYMYTSKEASPFEAMLAYVGDKTIEYETNKYNNQRLVAFSNWPTTDPFDYPKDIANYFFKMAKVDVEHIKTTDKFVSGQFASYHVYPYYPDYLAYIGDSNNYLDETGKVNTYYHYLKKINDYHSMPVVISEYGVSTGRSMAQKERYGYRSQGNLSENQQGDAIISCYEDIMKAGSAGSCVFTWQDEWFKRTWNTMNYIDLTKTPYWSDYQTNEQYFGLLAFDPGKEKSICYVDGDISDWKDNKPIIDNKDTKLYFKYDEKFMYFLIKKDGFNNGNEKLYIPIDTTQKTGSKQSNSYNVSFNRSADFLIVIDGKDKSRVLVQERYNSLRAIFSREATGKDAYINPPKKDSSIFEPIDLLLQTATGLIEKNEDAKGEVYETGLLTYGNANPKSRDFNSLADFCFNGDYIELKLPWQLLNFSNPSEMTIHDDYYENYGIENLKIDKFYFGIGSEKNNVNIPLVEAELKGWGKDVTYHERLKSSYYKLKSYWRGE